MTFHVYCLSHEISQLIIPEEKLQMSFAAVASGILNVYTTLISNRIKRVVKSVVQMKI